MNISIFGLGYVGCVGMGCMARQGHRVTGVDPQKSKVDFINAGKPTIIEKDIDHLIAERRAAGAITATVSTEEAIAATDVSLVCVGTPSTAEGHLDLSAIKTVAGQIGQALRQKSGRHVVAVRSTVLPGTGQTVSRIIAENSGREAGRDFAVVSNPEFLREGTSVEDFERPPFTLVGSECDWATEVMREVYAKIAAPFISTKPVVAELMKYVCNSFHALKITFANEVGNICKALEIDSHELMEIFCRDTQLNISKAYLQPGFAFGGSCLPKDLKALRTIAHDHYIQAPLLESIEHSNALQKDRVLKRILKAGKQNVGFLGLAFKAGTDDLRESPILDVIEPLLGKGFNVRIYDEHVHVAKLTGANRDYILQKIPYISRFITDDLDAVVSASELVVVVNKQPGIAEALRRCENKQILELSRTGVTPANDGTTLEGVAW